MDDSQYRVLIPSDIFNDRFEEFSLWFDDNIKAHNIGWKYDGFFNGNVVVFWIYDLDAAALFKLTWGGR